MPLLLLEGDGAGRSFGPTPPAQVLPALSYITAADFFSMPLDYDLSAYDESEITDILIRASGIANGIMRKSLLAQERTRRLWGNDTDKLYLGDRPLLYVRKIQFYQPGVAGYIIPLQNIMVDYISSELTQYAPIELIGVGYLSEFPEGIAIDVTYAWGYGLNPYVAPTWSAVDVPAGPTHLAPGQYVVGVTTKTMWGETLPSYQTITTETGAFEITVTPALGAYEYRVYAAPITGAPSALVSEIPAVTYGSTPEQSTISSLVPSAGFYAQAPPAVDTSAPLLPQEIREAVRLLALQVIYEQNNLANRGVQSTESGRKSIKWRSTEGNSGKGVPLYYEQATALLAPHSLQEIY